MDIRKEFLEFFQKKNHQVYSSMQLVPDDPTLLFTNSGMVQFKDIFTGSMPIPQIPRATSCQLCVRAGGKHNDLENVGYTARHHTLFEMLGNFSFGDYFKKDAIANAWEFVTEVLALPKEKLYVTVHESDDEAFDLWSQHIAPERIYRLGDKDNFWAMGDTGACGPCSEIFYDQGDEHFHGSEDYMGGDGDRFLEIWNLVFMQYERSKTGELKPLPKPSIDTGMGLERIVAIKEGKINNFDSSLFEPLIKALSNIVGANPTDANRASYRVIADHLRAVCFMLGHGVLFDKEGRGYVLRRILRRAVRHGYLLGLRAPFLYKLVDALVDVMGGHYRELQEKQSYLREQIELEEERFFKTIASGMELFNAELANTKGIFSGEIAFKLYDTFGFPLDLTQDMLREKGIDVDQATFDGLMQKQKSQAKASWKGSGDSAKEGDFKIILQKHGVNKFVGYEQLQCDARILTLLDENFQEVSILEASQGGWVMLDQTPFYATSGGQEGDIGLIGGRVVVATQKFFDLNLSKIAPQSSNKQLRIGENVLAQVHNREEIAKHHSATHLLQSALKKVLGPSVSQAGSLNDDTRLRFDFTYAKAMQQDQIREVEEMVNDWIVAGIDGQVEELGIEEAKQKGAIAMFGEKYGERVRVVSFGGDVSIEFCGGTHVKNSADIGSFYILKESGVSAGVRRIEAVVGKQAVKFANMQRDIIAELKDVLKTNDVLLGVKKLKDQVKELKNELKNSTVQTRNDFSIENHNGVYFVIDMVENGDIKIVIDELKNKYEKVAIFLFQIVGDKVVMASGVKGISVSAGKWIQHIAPILGGAGGGRADFAQAGGKDIAKIEEAKIEAKQFIKGQL